MYSTGVTAKWCAGHTTFFTVLRSKKKWLKLRVNISENKQRMGLKFCLAQFVMDMNLVLEYQKNPGTSNFFRVI